MIVHILDMYRPVHYLADSPSPPWNSVLLPCWWQLPAFHHNHRRRIGLAGSLLCCKLRHPSPAAWGWHQGLWPSKSWTNMYYGLYGCSWDDHTYAVHLPFWLRPWRSVSNVIGDWQFWELLGCRMNEHDLVFLLFLHECMKSIPMVFVCLPTERISNTNRKRDEVDMYLYNILVWE